MKKIYISVDMEGISTMVAQEQMRGNDMDQERREIATMEVNAAIEGACEAGADMRSTARSRRRPRGRLGGPRRGRRQGTKGRS